MKIQRIHKRNTYNVNEGRTTKNHLWKWCGWIEVLTNFNLHDRIYYD